MVYWYKSLQCKKKSQIKIPTAYDFFRRFFATTSLTAPSLNLAKSEQKSTCGNRLFLLCKVILFGNKVNLQFVPSQLMIHTPREICHRFLCKLLHLHFSHPLTSAGSATLRFGTHECRPEMILLGDLFIECFIFFSSLRSFTGIASR